jgi:hypothetical protein
MVRTTILGAAGVSEFAIGMGSMLFWGAALLLLAAQRLRKALPPAPTTGRRFRLRWPGFLRRRRKLDTLAADPSDERLLGLLPVRNALWLRARLAPVYDRERALRAMRWGMGLLLLGAGCFAMVASARDIREFSLGVMVLVWIGAAAVAALIATLGPAGDRRRGFLEHVLVTRMEPREIVGGTLAAVFEHLRGPALMAGLGYGFAAYAGALGPMSVVAAVVYAALTLAVVVIAACVALSARSPTAAIAGTVCVVLVILTAPLPAAFAKSAWELANARDLMNEQLVNRTILVGVVAFLTGLAAALALHGQAKWRALAKIDDWVAFRAVLLILLFSAVAALVAVSMAGTATNREFEHALYLGYPIAWIAEPIDHSREHSLAGLLRLMGADSVIDGLLSGVLTVGGVVFTAWWARSWTIRNFDRAVRRVDG